MTQYNPRVSARTVGIVAALVLPMILIPTSGEARSRQTDYNREYGDKPDRQALQRLFDKPAPRKSEVLRRARAKSRRHLHKRRGNRSGYYDERDAYDYDFASACVTPRQIHRMMRRQGWRQFHNLRIRPYVLSFKARQRNGLTYNLRVDRCTGSLIKAKIQFKDMWYIRWLRRISSLY